MLAYMCLLNENLTDADCVEIIKKSEESRDIIFKQVEDSVQKFINEGNHKGAEIMINAFVQMLPFI